MCLEKVYKTFTAEDEEYHKKETWYKVVIKDLEASTLSRYCSPFMFGNIKLGKTYTQKEERTKQQHGHNGYLLGYHFYGLNDARHFCASRSYYTILQCEVSHIVAKGGDLHGKACVALRFTATKEVK